jgi:hypothetical protein
MPGIRLTDEFKHGAVIQAVNRGYYIAESFEAVRDQHQVALHGNGKRRRHTKRRHLTTHAFK